MRSEASIRRFPVILIALLGVAALASARPAGAIERGTITLHGFVRTADGAPLENTWIYSNGSRRVSELSAADGSYTLEIPGGTVTELVRAPLELRILAKRRGWRLRLADGAPELLLELQILTDSTGMAVLRVRSSDPAIAAAIAGETVLAGGPSTRLEVNFRGSQEPTDGPKNAELTAVEEVVLGGLELPPGQPSAARQGPIVIPTGRRAGARTAGQATEKPARDVVEQPAAGQEPQVERPSAKEIEKLQREAEREKLKQEKAERRREAREEAARKKAAKKAERRRQEKKKSDAKKTAKEDAPAEPPGTPSEPESYPRVYRPAEPANGAAPPAEPRVYRPALPPEDAPPSDDAGPRVYRPAEPRPHAAATGAAQTPRVMRAGGTALFDSTSTMADSLLAVPRAGQAPQPEAHPAAEKEPEAPARKDDEVRSEPAATHESDTRSPAPPEPAPPPASREPAAEPDAWCTCRIEGFVEVQSEQRINGFLRVRVWLDGHPEIRGEVELFMGSPRAFVLRSVPCGPQTIRFEVQSKQPFDLISPEPKVDCTDGGMRQVRLVLQPSKRRR